MNRTFHVGLHIEGTLGQHDSCLDGMLCADGKTLSAAEVREFLTQLKAEFPARELFTTCDNQNEKGYCQGHPTDDQPAAPAPAQDELLPDEIHQMAFEEGQPAEDGDGYLFTAEEFDLFVERLLSRATRHAQIEQHPIRMPASAKRDPDAPASIHGFCDGWDNCLDAVAHLNAAPIAQTEQLLSEPTWITHRPLIRNAISLLRMRRPVTPDVEQVALDLEAMLDGMPTPANVPSEEWLHVAAQAEPAPAQDELWAVHAQGPDELYAAFSRADAEQHADALNDLPMPEGIRVSALVVPSPWPAAEHWKYAAELEREYAKELKALATRPAQTEQQPKSALDGWRIERSGDRILVQQMPLGAGYAAARAGDSGIAESVLYLLAESLLAAPIAQTADDTPAEGWPAYHKRKMTTMLDLMRGLRDRYKARVCEFAPEQTAPQPEQSGLVEALERIARCDNWGVQQIANEALSKHQAALPAQGGDQ